MDKRIVRNIPYALRGYDFKNKEIRAWFDRQEWYKVNKNYVASNESLTAGERKWLKYIDKKVLVMYKNEKE